MRKRGSPAAGGLGGLGDHVDHREAEALRLGVDVQPKPPGRPRGQGGEDDGLVGPGVGEELLLYGEEGEMSPALASSTGMPWARVARLAAAASSSARRRTSFSS